MSVYNEPEEWLRESIDSILNQTFSDFEFIIINDNPERELNCKVLNDYQKQDERIVVVENEYNIGLTKSLNKGLEIAKGKYIARMDADDISLPERLKKQVGFMESHAQIGVCGASILCFGRRNQKQFYPENDKDCFIFQRSPFAHPTVMIRNCVLKSGNYFYNSEFRYAQDYELWSRLSKVTCFHNLPEILLKYRVTDAQLTSKHYREQQFWAAQIRRRGFYSFCKKKNIDFYLSEDLSIKDVLGLKREVFPVLYCRKERQAVKDFCYYLYRSITMSSVWKTLWYWFSSGDFLMFSLKQNIRIVVYNLFRYRVVPML